MRKRRVGVALAMALGVASLAGCAVPSAYPLFDRDAGPEDVLGEDFDTTYSSHAESIDRDRVRKAATYEGLDLYLMPTTTGGICLEIRGDETESMLACSSGLSGIGAESPGGSFWAGPAPIAERDGWTILTENIRVRD